MRLRDYTGRPTSGVEVAAYDEHGDPIAIATIYHDEHGVLTVDVCIDPGVGASRITYNDNVLYDQTEVGQ